MPDPPDRKRALRREQQDDECSLQRHVADAEAVADRDRDERDRQHRQQLHRRCRQERDAQGPHDSDPVLLGHGAHPLHLRPGLTEQPQRRQADEDVVEVRSQALQRGPLAISPILGEPADQDHEHRDQGDRHEQDHRGGEVGGEDACAGGEREDSGDAQRRYVLPYPRVERVDPVGDERRDPGRGRVGHTAFVEHQRVVDHPVGDRHP